MAWIFCITGVLFCASGIFLFHRNAFEDAKTIRPAAWIIAMGIILITMGTARFFHLIH